MARNEEIFDVVDHLDQVIGQQTRAEVHRLGLRHRAVHVLIFKRSGEVFLQKRSMSKDTHPGVWDSSSSGHLDVGETYEDCALREVKEELGLDLSAPPAELFRVGACDQTGQEFVCVYRCEAEGPFELHPEEIETGGWFSPERVRAWLEERPADFAPAFALIWRRMSEPGGGGPEGELEVEPTGFT